MLVRRCMRWAVAAAGLTAAQTVLMPILRAQAGTAAASAPAASAPAETAPPSVCGSTPNCAESSDFAAMITNFRTSDLRGYKMLDVVVRFRNKTVNPLVLGYVQGSGGAVDEKGNRYSVFGGNGVRGIGQVSGNSFDPKFTLPAGGVGDAQFELAWYPGQEIYGFTFMLDLTVDEINSYQGNQHSLGGEFPLHFEGLTNGVSSGTALAAGVVPGASPCNKGGVAGTAMSVAGATGSGTVQNAAGQASSTVATAATTVSGITSLFHHKKTQSPAPGAQPSDPCASATPAAVAQAAPPTSTGPAVATATAAGAIAPRNPAPVPNHSGQTASKTASVTAAKPGTRTVATAGSGTAQPGTSAAVAKAPVITPAATTTRTATTVKPIVATSSAKKDTAVTRSKP
jgi:hypothetical protein